MSSVSCVKSFGTFQWDMIELAAHLRQERLFVNSEQQNLQNLNEKVLCTSSELAQQAWITAQQRVNLNRLIVARPDCTPASCCQRANLLENSQFIDAYKYLRHQACFSYGEFLGALRKSPKLLASCLVEGDKIVPETMQNIIQSLGAGLYGSCLLPEDKMLVLKLLKHLMLLQIIPSDSPRRLLRHGTCAFSRFYSVFHESLFSAKLFLTAALHGPIMQLLMEDEMFLDIDPDKAPIRFPPNERLKKFGKEGTLEYQTKLQRYRQWTINSLYRIAQRFIVSIRENMHCFPVSISWLVRQLAGLLAKSGNVEPKEVHAMCTDLMFTYFICPAIVNPEPYGITDAPISYVARFNLIQVGQILQMLSLIKYQTIDSKVSDLYRKFEKDSVSSILDVMLESAGNELEDEPEIIDNTKLQGLSRSAALFTENELNSLIIFLQAVNNDKTDERNDSCRLNVFDRKQLNELLGRLPSGSISNNRLISQMNMDMPCNKRSGILGKGRSRGQRVSSSALHSNATADGVDESSVMSSGPDEDYVDKVISQDVLVIPFRPTSEESVGLLSEQKVLCMNQTNNVDNSAAGTALSTSNEVTNGTDRQENNGSDRIETHEKRTRFSLSHDEVLFEGSIGNTSDNLEAVSEAASNHSVASSLELEAEDQNDNLSDMVSANVSGRGTPNISGRDTPSSQITEGDDTRAAGESRQLDLPSTTIPTKQSRSEIDDKFCKFEIKKLIEADETVSMVSDTWSTDVLASDSEIVEQQDRIPFPPSVAPTETAQPTLALESTQTILDISETASEAWSTDVLASDSERLTEVDTDDTASVARSDDTARSEIEVESRGEPEGGEETPPLIPPSGNSGATPHLTREESTRLPLSPTTSLSPPNSSSSVPIRVVPKPDYRRCTTEYVDKNANNISNVEYSKSVRENRLELDSCMSSDAVVRLSTTSLTSSSSSGSEPRTKHVTSTPEVARTVTLSSASTTNGNCYDSNATTSSDCNTGKSISTLTGTIPKSISFDMTAERGDKELLDDDQKNKRSFFGKLKMSLRNRRGKSTTIRGVDDANRCYERNASGECDDATRHRLRRIMSEEATVTGSNTCNDSTDDILAKYRRKPSVASDTASVESSHSRTKDSEDERLLIDPSNVEISFAFADAKRKLRMVLSTADLQHIPWSSSATISERCSWSRTENELVAFLQLQLAEAVNLQDRASIAHLHETLRCVKLFNDDECRKLFKSLREDYKKRSPYIAYLVRCRQGLLSTLAHLDRLSIRVKCDRDAVNNHLVSVCVRVFLERRESSLLKFCDEFRNLTLADEKQDLVDNFLGKLNVEMENDQIWQYASENQVELARTVIERTVMARVYHNALYPNGDGDVDRDQLLHDHIKKLAKVVTPNHKDLRIPKVYHYECPWPWAQAELAVISAYKTPRDKLQCVFRCATTIMNLLSMASERGIPAADDLIPVLVYVIIKTNPPSLLSTVQYVESFYGNRLEGEEQYWWTQFCSAIEFIKTMD